MAVESTQAIATAGIISIDHIYACMHKYRFKSRLFNYNIARVHIYIDIC
jgi:hypothetical protein